MQTTFKKNSTSYSYQKGKLINLLMRHGKKTKAEKIVKEAMVYVQVKHGENFSEVLPKAIENTASVFQLKNRRKGAQRLKVPFVLSVHQQYSSGLRKLIKEAKVAQGISLGEKLGYTLVQASKNHGLAVKEERRLREEVRKHRGNLYLRW